MVGIPPRSDAAAAPAGSRPRPGRARVLVALPVLAALAVGGCTKVSDATGASEAPAAQETAQGLTVAGRWPLTGAPSQGRAPRHPVLVVKIDNSEHSRPQVGLGQADLVTEELVEGGSTRLAVFYYEHLPERVGPVRSMRATDIGIVKPARAVLVASGGAPPTVRRVKAAGIPTFVEGATGYERDSGRRAPYNLLMALPRLAATVRAEETVPSYLPFGSADDLPRGGPARGLSAVFSGGHTTSWTYTGGRSGTYTNDNGYAAPGDEFRPDTVLVLRVPVRDAGYLDPAGNRVPETKFTGSGAALLFHGGRVVRGTWKKSLGSTISLSTPSGALTVPAGHTWVELVPRDGGRVGIRR